MTSPSEDPTTPPPAEELVVLQGREVRLRTEGHRLQVWREETWRDASLARLFPLSEPEGWIAVLDGDGKELGVLERLDGLDRESLAAAQEELRRRYVIPVITAVRAVRDRADITEWQVDTDRGPTTFVVRNLNDNLKSPLPGRIALTDVEGNRYDIPDLTALDPDSRRRVEERM